MGIADVLFEPADFLERSLEWAAGVVRGEITVDAARGRPGHVGRRARTSPGSSSTSGCTARCPSAVPGAGAARAGQGRAVRRRHRRRGRGARRPGHERRSCAAACTRSTWCSGGPSGRPARPDTGLARDGHQGRHRRRRPDGLPARAAVRPPAGGAGGADRPRPGPGRQGRRRTSTPRSTSWSAKGRLDDGHGGQAARPGHRLGRQGRLRRRRLRHRGGLRGPRRQEAGLGRAGEDRRAGVRAGHQHRPRCRSPRWPPTSSTRSGWSASTSSTRSR